MRQPERGHFLTKSSRAMHHRRMERPATVLGIRRASSEVLATPGSGRTCRFDSTLVPVDASIPSNNPIFNTGCTQARNVSSSYLQSTASSSSFHLTSNTDDYCWKEEDIRNLSRINKEEREEWDEGDLEGSGTVVSQAYAAYAAAVGNDDDIEGQDGDVLQVLKVGIQLALNERDVLLRQYERLLRAIQRQQQGQERKRRVWHQIRRRATMSAIEERRVDGVIISNANAIDNTQISPTTSANNRLLLKHDLVESMSMSSPKLNNRETEVNSRHLGGGAGIDTSKPIPSPKFNANFNLNEMYVEPVDDEGSESSTTWEYKTVTLSRVPGYGFGIAVSGGKDNPHFKSGDPSIVVSDVLRGGPAWGLLQINDRIISANGIGLEHADYATAVQIMKENEQLNLVVKRRVPLPSQELEQRHLKFTLTKSRRKDDFGIVLGCKFYIKGITNKKLAEKEPGLKPGDVVLKVNGQECEEMTLTEAKKLLEKSKDRLSLIIERDVPRGTAWKWPSQATLYERLGPGDTPRQSPIPRLSPMIGSRCSEGEPGRLNNTVRLSGRVSRLTSSEYATSPYRHSCGSQPPSRSRTPSQSVYDDYSNFSPRGSLPQTPPPRLPSATANSMDESHLSVAPPGESPVFHKPPLPSPHPEPRFISFTKESGSVGVRVIGGNEVGILVSAVQAGSPAAAKGVRPGDKILRVNNKDMRGVTREEAVLFLLGLQDQVDLVVQYRKDEYERIRAQNLGDNFYIRTHFDYEKPEQGEMGFRKGDIFQITDTLFSGTVGSWQAIRVSSPSGGEKITPESPQAKGVIPNASRAEQLLNAQNARAARSTHSENKTATLLRKKVSLSRRSKSLTKGHWDEVVFAHGTLHFPAYERVKLKHPGFLRPVILFGPLSDIAREQLLQDFPLRFAAPQNDMTNSNSTGTTVAEKGAGFVRLSAIREVMNKNKHCLLDVTPHSVEKLQYAQYCPIVIFISVDQRNRLRDLRKKHSKAAASKNSRKLQEQAGKIQKMYNYLFTAVLDASHEDHWFEALRELISHLQERRVWMAESRPADLLDDDFLFPMANSRISTNYAGDSDLDSLKGEGDYGPITGSCDTRVNESMESAGYCSSHGTRASCEPSERLAPVSRTNGQWNSISENSELYSNRDALIGHIATLRRPIGDAARRADRTKPRPPPRYGQYPPLPPKPILSAGSPTNPVPPTPPTPSVATVAPTSSSSGSGQTAPASATATPNESSISTNQSTDSNTSTLTGRSSRDATCSGSSGVTGAYQAHALNTAGTVGRNGRHFSEPGFYDVKQILADQSEDYVNGATAAAMYDNATILNAPRSPAYFDANSRFGAGDNACFPQPRYPVPAGGQNGSVSVHPAPVPNRPYDQRQQRSFVAPPAPTAGASPIARTTSLTTGTGVLPTYGSRSLCQPSPLVSGYHRRGLPHAPLRSPLPPPAPAPRSPHPHSPRLPPPQSTSATTTAAHSSTQLRFMDDDSTYASLPTLTNGDGHVDGQKGKENLMERRNGELLGNAYSLNTSAEIGNYRSTSQPVPIPNTGDRKDTQRNSATEFYGINGHGGAMQNGTSGCGHDGNQISDPHDGHAVLAHVAATIGPEGGLLASDATGVSISVPPGALMTKQEIFFKVFRDSSMSPPVDTAKGETLLSPLLMCGPSGLQFTKPVELRLPHCASGVHPEQWSFALKSASATRDGMPTWRQVAMTDVKNMQNGQINDKFVTIMIDHF